MTLLCLSKTLEKRELNSLILAKYTRFSKISTEGLKNERKKKIFENYNVNIGETFKVSH